MQCAEAGVGEGVEAGRAIAACSCRGNFKIKRASASTATQSRPVVSRPNLAPAISGQAAVIQGRNVSRSSSGDTPWGSRRDGQGWQQPIFKDAPCRAAAYGHIQPLRSGSNLLLDELGRAS